jgi:hypothetical protein
MDKQLSVVQLVHYTTQEYLDSIQAHKFPDVQQEITCTLLTFIAFDGFPDSSWNRWQDILPPLVEYSQYCLVHAAGQHEDQLKGMITEFLGQAIQWKKTLRKRGFFKNPMELPAMELPRLAITTICIVDCSGCESCVNCKGSAGGGNICHSIQKTQRSL